MDQLGVGRGRGKATSFLNYMMSTRLLATCVGAYAHDEARFVGSRSLKKR